MSRSARLAGRLVERLLTVSESVAPSLTFRLKRQFYRPDMAVALQALRRGGFAPNSVIDIGAFEGSWSSLCRSVFPAATVLMIEPGEIRAEGLRALCRRDSHLAFRQALLGAAAVPVAFREDASNSGVVVASTAGAATSMAVPLDALVAGTPFSTPSLIKVDVQGYELEVLKGASQTLAAAEVLILEISLIRLHPAAPSLVDVVEWLEAQGFRMLDICGFIRRPVDHALWQIDAVFVRNDSRLGHPSLGW